MAPTRGDSAATSAGPRTRSLLVLGGLIAAALILLKNPIVFVLLLADGVPAVAILSAATLGGIALVPLLRLGALPLRWQVLLGAGLGIGFLSIAVLVLGLAGVLYRSLWLAILALATIAGIARLRTSITGAPRERADGAPGRLRWLWLLVCPFLALAILAASVPPGYLWIEEGNGYDVLEYHLEMPKEYLAAGRIGYAPHNVYANFPANIEMLYLLCMTLTGDAIDAAGMCKMLNAALAGLVVAAAWLIGRQRSPAAGIVAGVVTAGVGWLTYLSGVAYVENGMLLWGMLAAAALVRAIDDERRRLPLVTVAGFLAGFSMGCKYTAVVLVAVPLAVGWMAACPATVRRRLIAGVVFASSLTVTFAPWAVKNLIMTGNPVFPLAGSVFTADPPGWGRAQGIYFAAAHAPGPDDASLSARLATLGRHLVWDRDDRVGLKLRFGPLLLILAAWGAAPRKGPVVRFAALALLAQALCWMFLTHLYARFAVPLLIPLVLLAGRVPTDSTFARRIVVPLIVCGTALNLGFLGRLYLHHMVPRGRRLALEGATGYFAEGVAPGHRHLGIINGELPAEAHILMVGDAKAFYFRRQVDYCVVFNRNPFVSALEAAAQPQDVVAWLTEQGYTHVLVNWLEIGRLRRSRYGFPRAVNRELFGRLASAGLARVQAWPPGKSPGIELYAVPAAP